MLSRKRGKDKSETPDTDTPVAGSPFDEPTETLPVQGGQAEGQQDDDGPVDGELGFTPWRRSPGQTGAADTAGETAKKADKGVVQSTDESTDAADAETTTIPSGVTAETTKIITPGGISEDDTATIETVSPDAATTAIPLDRDDFHRTYGRRDRMLDDDDVVEDRVAGDLGWAADTAALDPEWADGTAEPAADLDDAGRGSARRGDELEEARKASRRGTLDIGLLVLRVAVGIVAVVHGTQKLFGWWGGPHLSGFRDFLINHPNTNIGFNHDAAKPLAMLGALSESVGGLLLILGLLTPIAGSAVLGTWIIAAAYKATLSGGVWFFASDPVRDGKPQYGGIEYELLLCAVAAAIILTGPGRIALDFGRGWARRPWIGSVAWLVIGVAGAVVVWMVFNGTNPFHSPGNPTG